MSGGKKRNSPIPERRNHNAVQVVFSFITGETAHAAWSGTVDGNDTVECTTSQKFKVIVIIPGAKKGVRIQMTDRKFGVQVRITSRPGVNDREGDRRRGRKQGSKPFDCEFVKGVAITKRPIMGMRKGELRDADNRLVPKYDRKEIVNVDHNAITPG